MTAAQPTISGSGGVSLAERLRSATPAILFGLRLWASVCLSLYVAFALELSEPSWAATTAALVCQPVLGASLRKSMFRMIGTVIGAIAIVVLAAFCPPGSGGLPRRTCVLVRGLRLRRDALAQFRGLRRCARRLHSGDHRDRRSRSGWKHERHRLHLRHRPRARDLHRHRLRRSRARARPISGIRDESSQRNARLCRARSWTALPILLRRASSSLDQFRALRRDLLRRVIALDPMIDAAIGEASDLRYRSAVLQRAVSGLMETISAWRKVAFALARNSDASTPREAHAVHDLLPQDAAFAPCDRVRPRSRRSCAEPAARPCGH